ncbi:MAG: ferredoxin [Candidatus Omnitrophica bacterium]|nr:ferredoxin [Candidatus Omnitrophota bacterium]
MANRTQRLLENASGRYYVDRTCIDCDLCRQTAPANFNRNADKGYSYVSKQPTTHVEEKLCMQAKAECPVDSIGNDGGQ